jgi:DNA helicase HerA-like ATPase
VGEVVGATVVGEVVGATGVGEVVGATVLGEVGGATVVGEVVGAIVVGEVVGGIFVGEVVGATVVGEVVGATVATFVVGGTDVTFRSVHVLSVRDVKGDLHSEQVSPARPRKHLHWLLLCRYNPLNPHRIMLSRQSDPANVTPQVPEFHARRVSRSRARRSEDAAVYPRAIPSSPRAMTIVIDGDAVSRASTPSAFGPTTPVT